MKVYGKKSVQELVCLLLVFLLYHFCLRVQPNNLVYVTAGFVVSLQGFDEGLDGFLLAWVGHETPREN